MAAAPSFKLMEPLFKHVDGVALSFTGKIVANAITTITPLVTICLTIAFVLQGLAIMRGTIQTPVKDFVGRMLHIGIVVGFALTAGNYQTTIADFILTVPDSLATALIVEPSASTGKAGSLIDSAAARGFEVATKAREKVGLSGEGVLFAIIFLLVVAITAALCGIGGAILMLTKVALALMAALGPIFIVATLFETTKRFFETWMAQVFTYIILVVLFTASFGFAVNIFESFVTGIRFDGSQNMAYNVGGMVMLGIALAYLLWQLPSMATQLGQGISLAVNPRGPKDKGPGDTNGPGSNAKPKKGGGPNKSRNLARGRK